MSSSLHNLNILMASCLLAALTAGGCIADSNQSADAAPATAIDPATTQPSYWYDQPASGAVTSGDYDRLWQACVDVAHEFLFDIEDRDYRGGVLETRPLVSGQWFEPWRRDARTIDSRLESSLAAMRRSVRFEFTRVDGQTWQVTPKVLVERQAIAENRITSGALYRNIFQSPSRARYRASGSVEADQGVVLPSRYWYPVGRDATFEQALARAVEHKLPRR